MGESRREQTVTLSAVDAPVDVLFVAGEHSGDQHAARVWRELVAARPQLRAAAVGGEALRKAEATLLHDLTARSVVGLVEVLRHYRYFKRLFAALLAWIQEHRPRVVVLVDYPGFNLRLARALYERGLSRAAGGQTAIYYYISPQLWAWKGHRRFAMARHLDELGTIFPFEPEVYGDTGLSARFVGHPFVHEAGELAYRPDGPVLLLPGSRRQPVGRILPILLKAFSLEAEARPELRAVVPYPDDGLRDVAEGVLRRFPELRGRMAQEPVGTVTAGRAALTSSGTMSLACALAGIPGAIVYRAHPVTYWVGRRVVRIPYLGIANLILQRPAYREFIQGQASPAKVAGELRRLLNDPEAPREATANAEELRQRLRGPVAESAAQRILALLDQRGGESTAARAES